MVGLVHLVALPPLDLFADLRILLTRATSVPAFIALLLGVAVVRIVVLALLLGWLTRERLRFAALFYACAFPLLLVAATVDFAAYAVLYSRAFWPAVALAAVVVLVAAPAPWQRGSPPQPPRLWQRFGLGLRRGLRLEVMIPYAVVVVALGVVADLAGGWVTVLLVPVSALATAVAIGGLSRPATGRPLLRLAVAGLAAVLAGTAFVVTRTVAPAPPAEARTGSLMIMSGVNSSSGSGSIFETVRRSGARPAAPGGGGRPLAGGVGGMAAVATGRAPQVDVLVLVGPFPDSPVGFPPPGSDGPGRVAGDLLRLLTPLAAAADFHFEPDAPAPRDLLASPGAATDVFARPLPQRVRALSLTSATDLPLMPGGWRLPVERNACPIREAHPYLPETPALYHEVNRFLDGEPPLPCPRWRDWGAPMARPFGVPPDRAA